MFLNFENLSLLSFFEKVFFKREVGSGTLEVGLPIFVGFVLVSD
jgi:hypothetical protein